MAVPSHQRCGNGDWGSGDGGTRVLFGRAGRGEKEAGGCELGRRVSERAARSDGRRLRGTAPSGRRRAFPIPTESGIQAHLVTGPELAPLEARHWKRQVANDWPSAQNDITRK